MILRRRGPRVQWIASVALFSLVAVVLASASEVTAIEGRVEEPTQISDKVIDEAVDEDSNVANCTQTDYIKFRDCLESHRVRKSLETTGNPNNTVLEHCQHLNADCSRKCAGDASCENDCPVCPLNAASLDSETLKNLQLLQNCAEYNATCLSTCNSTECRSQCLHEGCLLGSVSGQGSATGVHTVIVRQDNGDSPSVHRFEHQFHPGQNLTTVIEIKNVVNNTNHVNAPVNITSHDARQHSVKPNQSGSQKLTNSTSESSPSPTTELPPSNATTGGKFGFGFTDQGSCCLAIRPKSCRASSSGMRCHHRRHRTCGPQCTARTIHVQLRQRCHSHEGNSKGSKGPHQKGCHNRVSYVPQPRPNCIYIDQWPYVSCTAQFERHLADQNCHGCYDHYGYGFRRYHEDAEHHRMRCRGCYDDAFEYGPLYRRGPVLRPYFYHQPPCYVTGGCDGWGASNCGRFGCFGDEFVDPAWGHHTGRHHAGRHHSEEDDYDYDDRVPVHSTPRNGTKTSGNK